MYINWVGSKMGNRMSHFVCVILQIYSHKIWTEVRPYLIEDERIAIVEASRMLSAVA